MTTFHEILGTSQASTTQEVKKRYKLLSAKCHPDKGGSNELFKLVKLAFDKVTGGYGDHVFDQKHHQSEHVGKQLRAQIRQLEADLSKQQIAKDRLNEELKKSKLEAEQLKEKLQQQSYQLAAFEKQSNAVRANSSNKTPYFSIIIMAILSAIAGFTVSERQYEDAIPVSERLYSDVPSSRGSIPDIVTSGKNEKRQNYKLLLMALRNQKNAINVVQDLKKRGYNASVEPTLDYFKVMVWMSASYKNEVDAEIDILSNLTGSQAKIVNVSE
ncbi:DnaJ domain-containing protein [Vibrio sp. 10N.261.54.A5]|uniref:DnaJ domain-containing protein n=1 Tax=Vibrio sp. 10N.261.54.A5 TaxID=3229686 RepID=UPI003553EF45